MKPGDTIYASRAGVVTEVSVADTANDNGQPLKTENYVDKTQGFLVKAWNLSSWPEYKSRLWNQDAPINKAESRKP